MTEHNPSNKGKKYKTIDKNVVYNLACVQCSLQEIGEAVGLGVPALQRRFGKIIEAGRQEGRKSLRRAQFEKAMKGDTKMLVWLGKQYLGHKDNPDDGEAKQPLPWED